MRHPRGRFDPSGTRAPLSWCNMAFDEHVAHRVRSALSGRPGLEERRMFGGLAFLLGGHMTAGVVGEELMLRVGPQAYDEVLRHPHVREMDFTGKPLRGLVYVEPAGFRSDADLRTWLARAAAFTSTLPPKPARQRARRAR
jgi:TfoX/Sxy family transcriptional regulator of competence genes